MTRKLRIILMSLIICSIGFPIFLILGNQNEQIVSNDERLIKIPLERIGLKQTISSETSALALWDGSQWHQVPFEITLRNEHSHQITKDLNYSDTEISFENDKLNLEFFIPYMQSKIDNNPPWWTLAQENKMNERKKISLKSSANELLEMYLYMGDQKSNFLRLPFLQIPLGTDSKASMFNSTDSSMIVKNTSKELFTLIGSSKVETNNDNNKRGGGQGASLQSSQVVYDRGDFFDHHEFRSTGWNPQVKTQYLPPRSYINGETLIVSGTSHGDPWDRYLSVKLNGVYLLNQQSVSGSFYYSWGSSTIHNLLDNDDGENEIEIILTTWTGYWRVDAFVNSQYIAEKHFNSQKSYFADDDNKYKIYNTGWSVTEFAVDVPRGISSTAAAATLKINGEKYEQYSRILQIFVDDFEVYYGVVSNSFSKSIQITNQAKYKDELKIGIVITTWSGYWLVDGYLETSARMDPFPDEPYLGNLWDDYRSTFIGGSTSLWHIKGNTNYFLGYYDFSVRSKANDFSNLYMAFLYHIPKGAEEELEDEYCDGFWVRYVGIEPESYITLTSSGWTSQDLVYKSYYGSPQDTGTDYGEVGEFLTDITLDIASIAGAPPLLSAIIRWSKYLFKTPVTGDKAFVSGNYLIIDADTIVVGSDDGEQEASRNGKFEFDMNPGTYSFTISVSLDVKMQILVLVWGSYQTDYIDLASITITHSVTIQIF